MTLRFFVVPELLYTEDGRPARRPAYVVESGCTSWGALDYGPEPVFLLAADVDAAQAAFISAGAGAVTVPAALDSVPAGAALTQTKAALEALNIPAGAWVDGLTYRQIVRIVAMVFLFVQRWRGLGGGRIFGSGIALDTTLASLPQAAQDRLQAVADSFGYSTAGVTTATTVRDALHWLGRQWADAPITLGFGVTL